MIRVTWYSRPVVLLGLRGGKAERSRYYPGDYARIVQSIKERTRECRLCIVCDDYNEMMILSLE